MLAPPAKNADAKSRLYTGMLDRDFIIDRLPGAPNIIVASRYSGHGFKFAPGERRYRTARMNRRGNFSIILPSERAG